MFVFDRVCRKQSVHRPRISVGVEMPIHLFEAYRCQICIPDIVSRWPMTHCGIILFGDYRQNKPCEPGYFLDRPCVMYLTRSNRTELSKIHRYDNALLEVSDLVWDNGYLPKDHIFGAEECRKSIAFHRSKIDEVNHMWNLRETPDRFIQSNQWNIYVELPVVCRKSTSKDNKDFQCRNNEECTVVRFTKKRFLCIVKLQTFLERR
jgi:hypothetical protein